MLQDFFKGKKITLMGLGLLGRGVGDALFLAQHGAELTVTDMKTAEQLVESVEKLSSFKNVTFALGGHRLEDFQNRDLIIRAANVPLDSVFLKEAQKNGIPIEQSVSLFVQLLHEYKKNAGREHEKYLVGVTGSKGKTTVTHLIYEMLSRAFPERRVRMGGNVQGISTLAYLDDVQPDDLFVLELDSWQLASFGDKKMSPHVAVFTTFLPDHMNYYKGDMDRYFNDKANIFCFQDDSGVCFIGENVGSWVAKHHPHHAERLERPEQREFQERSLSLKGKHNTENIALAASAARSFGVRDDVIENVVAHFAGVPGRLQFLFERDGISYYNDTTATMPDAVVAALEALGEKRNIILILGGADKELPLETLAAALPRYARSLVFLEGTGTDRIRSLIADADFEHVVTVGSMQEAVAQAHSIARKGDSILLSPGFASFGMFVNEYDRGDQFIQEVQAYA
ncbi:MAG: UDP-N-acetylmuramoylalanine--D-glutamate ligase [Candidatus Campbellbacteria bacterium]